MNPYESLCVVHVQLVSELNQTLANVTGHSNPSPSPNPKPNPNPNPNPANPCARP